MTSILYARSCNTALNKTGFNLGWLVLELTGVVLTAPPVLGGKEEVDPEGTIAGVDGVGGAPGATEESENAAALPLRGAFIEALSEK
jgi:hypothetical protein